MVQALAAVAVHDPSAPGPGELDRIRAAVAATRCGAVVVGRAAGRVSGLIGAQVVAEARSATSAAHAVLDAMVGPDDELVTVVTGELVRDRVAGLERTLGRVMRRHHPNLELVVVDGRLPGVLLEVGVE
jgi:dihydroxyacetone kinase-like predicted kinase